MFKRGLCLWHSLPGTSDILPASCPEPSPPLCLVHTLPRGFPAPCLRFAILLFYAFFSHPLFPGRFLLQTILPSFKKSLLINLGFPDPDLAQSCTLESARKFNFLCSEVKPHATEFISRRLHEKRDFNIDIRDWVGRLIPVQMTIRRMNATYQDATQRMGKTGKEIIFKLTKKKKKKKETM